MDVKNQGFTLVETAATMAILAIVAVGLVSVSNYVLETQQRGDTIRRAQDVRRAISGNPVIIVNESRTSFGYVGDMGKVPDKLSDLWVKGQQPTYTFDSNKKVGAGWNGPYLEIENTGFSSTIDADSWGNKFVYNTTSLVHATFGQTVLAQLVSLGPDFTNGTNDDITLNFFKPEVQSRVQGYVKKRDNTGFAGVKVTLNYPANGVLTTASAFSDSDGYYFFPDIPYGNRSVFIEPKLVVVPGTVVLGSAFVGGYSDVSFTLRNYGSNDISVASLSLQYDTTPNAYFTEINLGVTKVWTLVQNGRRFGSGDTVSFTPVTVLGSGALPETIQLRLQSPVTDVDDIVVSTIRRSGGSLTISFKGFNNYTTGTGTADDVTGIDFNVTLKNAAGQEVGFVTVTPGT